MAKMKVGMKKGDQRPIEGKEVGKHRRIRIVKERTLTKTIAVHQPTPVRRSASPVGQVRGFRVEEGTTSAVKHAVFM